MDWLMVLIFYLLPMYFANSTAMLCGGGRLLDFGKNFSDGRQILGSGKTWRGTLAGIFFGTLSAFLLQFLFPFWTAQISLNFVFFGFLVSLGAILGDLVESFFKRRAGMQPGQELFLLDQLDFLFGGLVLGLIEFTPSLEQIALAIILTLIMHRLSNFIAFKAKLKKVPW